MEDEAKMSDTSRGEWYFNTEKQVPEQGKRTRIENRMGPYSSREEALKAWKIVQERNKKWEDDDRKWENAGETPTKTQ
jgi:hypothetical protein